MLARCPQPIDVGLQVSKYTYDRLGERRHHNFRAGLVRESTSLLVLVSAEATLHEEAKHKEKKAAYKLKAPGLRSRRWITGFFEPIQLEELPFDSGVDERGLLLIVVARHPEPWHLARV